MYVESSGCWHEKRSSDVKWSRSDGQTSSPLTTDVRFNAAKTFQTLHSPYLWSQAATPLPVPLLPLGWSPPVSFGWNDAVWKVERLNPGGNGPAASSGRRTFSCGGGNESSRGQTSVCLCCLHGLSDLWGVAISEGFCGRGRWFHGPRGKKVYYYTKLSSVIGILDTFYFSVNTVLI